MQPFNIFIFIYQPRQLNKTRMVVDEFDGTFVDSDEVMDDFETNDNLPSSMSDQKINSGIHVWFTARNIVVFLSVYIHLISPCTVQRFQLLIVKFMFVSDNLSENDKSRISYMKIVSSWCTCLDDGLNESSDLQDNIQKQIFEYFQLTVKMSLNNKGTVTRSNFK